MTEQRNKLVDLFAACWKDEPLKARFMADPKAVLAEYDMPVPDGIDVKVVENTDDCVYITLPKRPSGELSDEELESAAGGGDAGQTDSESGPRWGFIRSMAS
ncbi:MAG: NHLP leader peptide family natural product precursor [Planctomycetaceae bacterium]|nr:NHLP leader peptide family natural product precursor [Planctomycetaceae bacterium]